jgi:hypothetical protein
MRKFAVRRIVLGAVAGILFSAVGTTAASTSVETSASDTSSTSVTAVSTPSGDLTQSDSQPWT